MCSTHAAYTKHKLFHPEGPPPPPKKTRKNTKSTKNTKTTHARTHARKSTHPPLPPPFLASPLLPSSPLLLPASPHETAQGAPDATEHPTTTWGGRGGGCPGRASCVGGRHRGCCNSSRGCGGGRGDDWRRRGWAGRGGRRGAIGTTGGDGSRLSHY